MSDYDFTKQPSILIQGAMESETAYLIGHLDRAKHIEVGNWSFHTGFLGEQREPVIISRTYQGMVNAAAATSLALFYFAPRAVINQGIAGGHDFRFHRGDIVVGERVVPMGAMIYGFSKAGAGVDAADFEPKKTEVYIHNKGRAEKVYAFSCDEELVSLAAGIKTKCRVGRGTIGSADEWNNQLDRIALLRQRYQTAAEDMETAAAAQVCLSYGVPFIGIRILSNSIVHGEEFDESMGLEGQKFIMQYVNILHEQYSK